MHPWHKDGSPRRMIVALFHVRQSDRFARPHRTQTLWLETFRLFSDRPVPDDQPILPCCSHFLTWSSAFCHKKVSICLAFHFLWRIKVPSRLVPPPPASNPS